LQDVLNGTKSGSTYYYNMSLRSAAAAQSQQLQALQRMPAIMA
jgi:hypothetical protein